MEKLTGWQIQWSKDVSSSLVHFLSRTVYGKPGGLQYRHLNVLERLGQPKTLQILSIKKEGDWKGTAGFAQRSFSLCASSYQALYVRYFSIRPSIKGRRGKSHYRPRKEPKEGSLKLSLLNLIDGQLAALSSSQHPSILYAYIEQENTYSKELSVHFGFEKTRMLSTFLFSRFFPKKDKSAQLLNPKEQLEIQDKIDQFYRNHSFYSKDCVSPASFSLGYKWEGKVVAGIQATPVEWEIVGIPGWSGFFLQKIVPYIPLLSKTFQTEQMRFLAIDNVWFEKGHEHCLPILIETAFAHAKRNIGILWADEDGPISHAVKAASNQGFLSKLHKNIPAEILVRFGKKTTEEDKTKLFAYPAYISALDIV